MAQMAKLRGEHARLSALVVRLNTLVAADSPPPGAELQTVRQALAATLIAHLQAEDWLLYPELLDHSDPAIVAVARRFSAEMGDLATTFMDYSGRWIRVAASSDWPRFCNETRAITDALAERIEREDRFLYPLLEPLERAA